jgi:hypothetical protein
LNKSLPSADVETDEAQSARTPVKMEDFEYGLRLLAKLIAAKLRAEAISSETTAVTNQ